MAHGGPRRNLYLPNDVMLIFEVLFVKKSQLVKTVLDLIWISRHSPNFIFIEEHVTKLPRQVVRPTSWQVNQSLLKRSGGN